MGTNTNFENNHQTASLFDLWTIRAGGVSGARPDFHRAGSGSNPTSELPLIVWPIPVSVAKKFFKRHHYLHSFPCNTQLAFGVFIGSSLLGALTRGAGSANAHRLMSGARHDDCSTLSRFWLSDAFPKNVGSRVIGIAFGPLKSHRPQVHC